MSFIPEKPIIIGESSMHAKLRNSKERASTDNYVYGCLAACVLQFTFIITFNKFFPPNYHNDRQLRNDLHHGCIMRRSYSHGSREFSAVMQK